MLKHLKDIQVAVFSDSKDFFHSKSFVYEDLFVIFDMEKHEARSVV